MALIEPYADPSAHGKVTPGLMFKRKGSRVVFGAAPRPRDKNSPAQQTQRNKIRQAVANYKILNYEEKIFLRRRGSMLGKNPYQLYTKSQLRGNDWSKTQGHQLQIINNMVIFNRQQDDANDMKLNLKSTNTKDIADNIILYNKLDSETAGIITSDTGPNFTWTGTPNHDPLKFINGAWSYANNNYIQSNDNGDFLLDNLDEYILSFWTELTYDLINGIPQDAQQHVLYTWRGANSVGGANYIYFQFRPALGLFFSTSINGVYQDSFSVDPNLTYSAGQKIYISIAYKKTGIDDEAINFEISVGTDTTLNKIIQKDFTLPSPSTTSTKFVMLAWDNGTLSMKGGIDNVKAIKKVTRNTIDEMNNTRNVELFETELGYVFDNENIFYPGAEVDVIPELQLIIENFAALDWAVPFYWALAITWSNQSITERTTIIRLPKIVINSSEAIVLYLSTDMSNYFDEKLFRLGATDNV